MRSATVLIADDSRTVRRLIRLALEKNSHTIVETQDGQEALSRLDEGPAPDLLITDVNMSPEEFGYTGDEAIDMVSTRANASEDISVNGYEFEFNHALDYLPGALGGLTVRGSYTHTNPSQVMPRVTR